MADDKLLSKRDEISRAFKIDDLDLRRRNIENLLPAYFVEEYPNFVQFISTYYDFLEADEGLDNLIERLIDVRNPDVASEEHLDRLKETYGPSFPAGALDKATALKIFEDWYKSKGNQEAIEAYFRIFLGTKAEVVYPKDNMLRVSDGNWDADAQRYIDQDGHLSEASMVIQDSVYYQIFSYVIRSGQSIVDWGKDWRELGHPAGWNLFGEVQIEGQANFEYQTSSPTIVPGLQVADAYRIILGAVLYSLTFGEYIRVGSVVGTIADGTVSLLDSGGTARGTARVQGNSLEDNDIYRVDLFDLALDDGYVFTDIHSVSGTDWSATLVDAIGDPVSNNATKFRVGSFDASSRPLRMNAVSQVVRKYWKAVATRFDASQNLEEVNKNILGSTWSIQSLKDNTIGTFIFSPKSTSIDHRRPARLDSYVPVDYLLNGDFSQGGDGLDNWTESLQSNGTATVASNELTIAETLGSGGAPRVIQDLTNLVVGDIYAVFVEGYGNLTANGVQPYVYLRPDVGTSIAGTQKSASGPRINDWRQISFLFEAQATSQSLILAANNSSSGVDGTEVKYRNVQVVRLSSSV